MATSIFFSLSFLFSLEEIAGNVIGLILGISEIANGITAHAARIRC